jgi:hypothetical protein
LSVKKKKFISSAQTFSMKIIIVILIIFLIPSYLKGQTFPLGKSKEEVREYRATVPHSATPVSQSDTCDVYQIGTLIQENYYYKNNICYKSNQIYSMLPFEKFDESVLQMQRILNGQLKKIKENVWTNPNGTERIELIVVNDKNQYIVEISTVVNKN